MKKASCGKVAFTCANVIVMPDNFILYQNKKMKKMFKLLIGKWTL